MTTGESIDIQSILSKVATKLGVSTTKIPGEMHLPGYSFSGPGTSITGADGRTARCASNLVPYEWSKPINFIDELCYYHDIAYLKAGDNLDLKHIADNELLIRLNDYTPANIAERLVKFAIEKAIGLKVKFGLGCGLTPEVAKQISKEIHTPFRQGARRSVYSPCRNHVHSCDLMEFPPDNGYKYLLTYIDIFSKLGYGFALTNKKPESIIDCLKVIFPQNKPVYIWSDQGTEFTNHKVQSFLKENNVSWYTTYSELKAMICERWNRSIRTNLEKIKTELELQGKPYHWTSAVRDVIETYNNTVHHTTKLTPVEGHLKENEEKIRLIYFQRYLDRPYDPPKYKVNDTVRLYRYRGHFEKHSGKQYTEEVFKIKEIHETRPITYTLEDMKGEVITGKVYQFELTKGTPL